jgi:signal transduction histidine kinase
VSKGTVIGAFYLTDKKDAREFSDDDQALIERFAAHAAVIVSSARLFEESRELHVVEERNRLARDLHDSVNQTLFSLNLTAEAAADLIDRDPARAKEEVRKVAELAQSAIEEMRGLVFQLRPPALEADGLISTLRKHVDVARRAYGTDITFEVTGTSRLPPEVETGVFRIVQEALNNALKHSDAASIAVELTMENGLVHAYVRDDGVGFDPRALPVRAKHLGMTSMEERAQGLGGELAVESAPGRGTTVSLEVKL